MNSKFRCNKLRLCSIDRVHDIQTMLMLEMDLNFLDEELNINFHKLDSPNMIQCHQ